MLKLFWLVVGEWEYEQTLRLRLQARAAGREPNIIGGRSMSRSEGGHCQAVRC